MTGDTRIVMATTRVASRHHDGVIGLRVLHHGEVANGEDDFVHDCVLRIIGFTLLQGDTPILQAVHELEKDDLQIPGPATSRFLHRLWALLNLDQRLVETHTGADLTHVNLVKIDDSLRISEVLS